MIAELELLKLVSPGHRAIPGNVYKPNQPKNKSQLGRAEEVQPLGGFSAPMADIRPMRTWIPRAQVGSQSVPALNCPRRPPAL